MNDTKEIKNWDIFRKLPHNFRKMVQGQGQKEENE
jgi:hypothetical protein